jgi:hypothetical protein
VVVAPADATDDASAHPWTNVREVSRYSFAPRHNLPAGRGGFLALTWPLITIALALGSMRGSLTGLTDPSTPVVAGLLFLIAVPTTWVFAWLQLDAVVAVVLGLVTSLPIWFFVGGRLAALSPTWGVYWRRYIMMAIGWAVLAIVLLAVVATIAS